MTTIEQCRAARGLLGWTQQDLADACGLSKTAINNFEKGHSDIKTESLNAVRMAFESMDIEFLPNQGLRKRTDSLNILRGHDALSQLFDDIYFTLKNTGGEVLITNINTDRDKKPTSDGLEEQHARLKSAGITQRVIHAGNTNNQLNKTQGSHRALPTSQTNIGMTSFVYGDKLALEMWDQSMIIIIDSSDANNSEQNRFEYLWQKSTPEATKENKTNSTKRM